MVKRLENKLKDFEERNIPWEREWVGEIDEMVGNF